VVESSFATNPPAWPANGTNVPICKASKTPAVGSEPSTASSSSFIPASTARSIASSGVVPIASEVPPD